MKKKKILVLVIGILFITGITIGISYAWWSTRVEQKSINTIKSDCLKLELVDENPITLQNAYPITDEEANDLIPYTFTIKNTCNTSVIYDVVLEIMEASNRLKSEYIAISVNQEEKRILDNLETTTPSYKENGLLGVEARKVTNGVLNGGSSVRYELKLWMDESVTIEDDAMNKSFTSKIVVNGSLNPVVEKYKESILNGADPVLASNLIAVEISDTGVVTKADLTSEWYSYENKKWANAIILEDETVTYEIGEEIPEENIESYFVWIPKYSYQLWDLGEYDGLTNTVESKIHKIPIKFGLNNTSDSNNGECTTPGTSGSSGNCVVGDYMTHPAFLAFGTNGLWVGKFEAGYKGETSASSAQVNANQPEKLQIKPNVYSWRGIQPANAHLTSYNYQRDLDSHMMKNTEWGAVAYLQHSRYGSATSVRINNNSAFITGYAATEEPTCGYIGSNDACNKYESTGLGIDGSTTINYKNPASQVASTTGNYSGIYDMSGGTWEYVMGVMLDETNTTPLSGRNSNLNSGFNGGYGSGEALTTGINFPEEKYYDKYLYSTSNITYTKRILGDATGEMGPFASVKYGTQTRQISSWYNDEAWIVNSLKPWILRGGGWELNLGAGIFDFDHEQGKNHATYGFRIVLAI